MKAGTAICMFGFVICGVAHASGSILGQGAARYSEKNYPAFCRIEVEQNFDKTLSCSGTLVGPNEIATGGHCFGKHFDLRYQDVMVRCGGRTARVVSVDLPPDHLWADTSKPFSAYDYARVTIRDSLTGSMPRATGPGLYFEDDGRIRAGVRCWIAGFGKSRTARYGDLYIAEITRQSLSYGAGLILMKNPTGAPLEITADHGDSGGALFCVAPGNIMEHLAVIVGYRSQQGRDRDRMENDFAAIWSQDLNH